MTSYGDFFSSSIILLVGATGVGKSTIINTITNYFRNGSLDDIRIAIPTQWHEVTEHDLKVNSVVDVNNVFKSQTSSCINYNFVDPENKYTFIDTPSLSDTRSKELDGRNLQTIIESAISQHQLTAIVLVVNGTESRITESIQNDLIRLSSNLPDNLFKENLLLIVTNSIKSSSSFSLDIFKKEVVVPKQIYYMNNMTFCSDPINEMKPISTQEFVDIKAAIEGIRAEIFNAKNNLQNIYAIKEEVAFVKEERDKIGEPQHILKPLIKKLRLNQKSRPVILTLFVLDAIKFAMKITEDFFHLEQTKVVLDIIRDLDAEYSLRKKMCDKRDSYGKTMDKQQSELDKLNSMKNECLLSIIELGNKMKSICSRCDLKRELLATIGQLEKLLNNIKISTVREEANKDIESVLKLLNII
ncbi:19468_t:CDS:2 [Cetraspora pellucida]|uniref:19468_t:CDS:1 n=1 Tax=Cetraspora pellucida TaxID=1433469 RepID=A0A9N9F5R7_9GLOM|nr:19468_t:CDS:2 [Cetraspora pellucida]